MPSRMALIESTCLCINLPDRPSNTLESCASPADKAASTMSRAAPFVALMDSVVGGAGKYAAGISAGWMQGRTTFGGCSAALCLEGARRRLLEDAARDALPTLRSAQVSFVGAAGGEVEIVASIVRQGKAMSFVRADLYSSPKPDAPRQLATTALFAFGAARESALDADYAPAVDTELPSPDQCGPFFDPANSEFRPQFTHNFDARLAQGFPPFSGAASSELWLWVRHLAESDESAGGLRAHVAPDVALLALADMPPPAICSRLSQVKPVSSVTWQINFLRDSSLSDPADWWLVHTRAEHARHGYSSQDMAIWNSEREPCATARQCVAYFD